MALPNTYHQKAVVRCTGTFRNVASDTLVDPTTIIFKYMDPAGTITTLVYGTDPKVTRSSVGVYYVDLDVDTSEGWHYRFESEDAGGGAEASFQVLESVFD